MKTYNYDLSKQFDKLKIMIIEKQITQTQQVEVRLPFFSQANPHFYMITESEDVIWVYYSDKMTTISSAKKDCVITEDNYRAALRGTEITEKDFWAAYDKAVSIMQQIFPIKAGAVNQ